MRRIIVNPVVAAMLWALSLLTIDATGRSMAPPPDVPQTIILVAAILCLFASSWHLLWVGLACTASWMRLPSRIRRALTEAVDHWGGQTAQRIARRGAATLAVAGACGMAGAAAWASTPSQELDLLWPDSTVTTAIGATEPMPPEPNPLVTTAAESADLPPSPTLEGPVTTPDHDHSSQVQAVAPLPMTPTPDGPSGPESGNAVDTAAATPVPASSRMSAGIPSHDAPSPLSPGPLHSGTRSFPVAAAWTSSIEQAAVASTHVQRIPEPTTPDYQVVPGDSLWTIAEGTLLGGPHEGSEPAIEAMWRTIYQDNRATIGDEPGLIRPGMHLTLPLP